MKLTITDQFKTFLKSIGIEFEAILQRANIPNRLWQEEVSLNTIEYYNMLVELDKEVPESAVRALSDITKIQMFMPSFFAALSSQNGEEAIKRFAKFKKLVGPVELEYFLSDMAIGINFTYVHKQQTLPKFAILNEQLLLLSILRKGTGENIVPILVETPFDYEAKTIEMLGVKPQKAEYNQIVFAKKDIEKVFLTQNNLMFSYIEPELNRQLVLIENEKSVANFIQKELLSAIPSGHFTLEQIAEKLGMSGRTLQRNLSAENTSYKEQMQMVQKSMTFSYLRLNVSTDEIAYLVGYTEINAFLRTFKSWTGKTLIEYKREMDRV